MFPKTSRYYNLASLKWVNPQNEEVIYLRRRIVPGSTRFVVAMEHTFTQGEQLDNITARYLGDPEQFWQLCDANNARHPDELVEEIGKRLTIPLMRGGN